MEKAVKDEDGGGSAVAGSIKPFMFPLSFTHRIFHPPKLERKHSSGDLHSRLKTRKILGVGETDNGDIHRSKISQLLGHNEHLYVKFPRGFRMWHLILATLLTIQGILALIVPSYFHFLFLEKTAIGPDATFATRLLGATLFGMAIFVWSLQGTNEKSQARISLAAIVTQTLLQIIVNVMGVWGEREVSGSVVGCLASRALIVLISLFYYHAIGSSMAGLRKSASYKDLLTAEIKSPAAAAAVSTAAAAAEKKDE